MPVPNRCTPRARATAIGLVLALVAAGAPAATAEPVTVGPESRQALALTVYNTDLALISERRRIDFAAGLNELVLHGVSRQIQPETLSLDGPGLALLEQAFEANLLSADALFERALGGTVWVRREAGDDDDDGVLLEEGTLVSLAEPPLVRFGDRLESVPRQALIYPAALAAEADLRSRPALTATLEAETAGPRALSIGYLTGGLTWQADYVGVLAADDASLSLSALVTLENHSGTAYEDASLRLVAGDVNRERDARPMMRSDAVAMAAPAPEMAEDFARAPVGDLHVYRLARPVTLPDRTTKQVRLSSAPAVEVAREYRFEQLVSAYGRSGEIGPVHAAVVLELQNEAESGLGQPLPQGIVRIYQASGADGGGADVFLGEDRIEHTPEGAEIRLDTGRAFDVTGKARQTHFERLSDKSYETGQEITVMNAKDSAVEVKVVGELPPGWRMVEESLAHERETATRVAWTLEVPAKGETSFEYRIRVTQQ